MTKRAWKVFEQFLEAFVTRGTRRLVNIIIIIIVPTFDIHDTCINFAALNI